MPKKILIYTTLIFVLFNLVLVLAKPTKLTPQSNYDFNVVKAQEYINNCDQYSAVILGSSLGNRIDSKLFSKDFYFLTFSGLGSADGLEVIKNCKSLPEVVFIEINVVERTMNEAFIADVFNLAYNSTKNLVPTSHRSNKPASILHKPLAYLIYGLRNQFNTTSTATNQINLSIVDSLDFSQSPKVGRENTESNNKKTTAANLHFKSIEADLKNKLPEDKLKNAITEIKGYVRYLESKGVKFVFYEMPIDTSLKFLSKPAQIRTVFFKEFPKEQYRYIKANSHFKVISNDGIHLTGRSIEEFSHFFRTAALNSLKD